MTEEKAVPSRRGPGRPPKEEPRRKERVPLGRYRSKLQIPDELVDRKNYVPRWINDTPGRVAQAIEGGYEHVKNPNSDENMKEIVGRNEDGSPMTAYLMQISKEFYEEDQAEKQRQVDLVDEAIRGGKVGETPGDMRYPAGIKYQTTKD